MIKIIIINHTFQKAEFCKRWSVFAQKHKDVDVTLLAPAEWTWGGDRGLTYGHVEVLKGKEEANDNFRIRLIDIEKNSRGDWTSKGFEQQIKEIEPDIVYYIGGHNNLALMTLYQIKKKLRMPKMKILVFSMRGKSHGLELQRSKFIVKQLKYIAKYCIFKKRLNKLNKNTQAIFCHFPVAVEEFRREGFKGPIYMQTQVGVDPDIFYPNETSREKIRNKYNIGDAYLFGSASRFDRAKGLIEIIRALPEQGNWKYLMMGWGRDDEVELIKEEIAKRGLQDKIILTGFIDNWTDMAEHWNALDCAVHAPLTTKLWEETFSLALVQAMATGLPVIGSSSGSVPYQIGQDGIIVPEGDVEQMRNQMLRCMSNPDWAKEIGLKMKERAVNCFGIYHLTELFYLTIKDIINDKYDFNKSDMATFKI